MPATPRRVGLFVTCLVDLFRPTVGFAAAKLLERAGCEVEVPAAQVCCGQPAYNSGDRDDTKAIARNVIEAFEPFNATVAPSGSCAGMIKRHYPALFAGDPHVGAARPAPRRAHLRADLVPHRSVRYRGGGRAPSRGRSPTTTPVRVCASSGSGRSRGACLEAVEGLELAELSAPDVCCGFGGTFCVKYPDISGRMVADKAKDIAARPAPTRCSRATWAACSTSRAGSAARARP